MVVRPVTEKEHDAWQRMRAELFPDTSEDDHKKEIADVLDEATPSHCFIALLDDKPVGFLEVAIRDWAEGCKTKNVGYLEALYVDEFFRRSGVAKALIRAGEHWARGKGAEEIASDVEIDNEESLALHHQMQYQEVGRSVLFRKSLV